MAKSTRNSGTCSSASDETLPVVEAMPLLQLQHYVTETVTAHTALEDFFLRVEIKPDMTGHHAWPPRFEERQFREKQKKHPPVRS